jgi:hypothetical protein
MRCAFLNAHLPPFRSGYASAPLSRGCGYVSESPTDARPLRSRADADTRRSAHRCASAPLSRGCGYASVCYADVRPLRSRADADTRPSSPRGCVHSALARMRIHSRVHTDADARPLRSGANADTQPSARMRVRNAPALAPTETPAWVLKTRRVRSRDRAVQRASRVALRGRGKGIF